MRSIVIIGGGAAGLSAAIASVEASSGVRVTVLEAADRVGGSSARAVGSITACQTDLQRSRNIDDDPRDHLEDLVAGQEASERDPALSHLEAIAQEAGDAVSWLERLGVTFAGPHPELPHRVPRMHSVQPNGQALLDRLAGHAIERGVEVLTGSRAAEIVTRGGEIEAVRVTDRLDPVPATEVILAAGDASARLHAEDSSEPRPVYRHAMGDAFDLARDLGAVVNQPWPSRQIRSSEAPHYHPDRSFFEAGVLAVERETGKFLTGRHEELADALNRCGEAFLVFDRSAAERIATAADDSPGCRDGWLAPDRCFVSTFPGIAYAYLDDLLALGLGHSAPDLGSLTTLLGLPSNALVHLAEPPFSLGEPPFYSLGPMGAFVVLADGGLTTDRHQRVRDTGGLPVPGLYAAGSSAWGKFRTRGHGVHLAWAVVSGRRAGYEAAMARCRATA